ncbi:hypothetical protein HAX54_024863 [Datura stramonium]|uniref:Uncharacterized protein n=1 Tax=Datura stramonium TaxID=4076 RepID=A0ABS8V121_DATST|nr:hypothetical protein [Datura stramonium]
MMATKGSRSDDFEDDNVDETPLIAFKDSDSDEKEDVKVNLSWQAVRQATCHGYAPAHKTCLPVAMCVVSMPLRPEGAMGVMPCQAKI